MPKLISGNFSGTSIRAILPFSSTTYSKLRITARGTRFRTIYPHHQFELRNDTWQGINANEPQLFREASLVISATADWNTDDALNTWHVDCGKTPPIVYG